MRKAFVGGSSLLLFAALAYATAQVGDILILDGKEYGIQTNPLREFLATNPDRKIPEPDFMSTANWRGYIATWEIRDGRLFLKDIEIGSFKDQKKKDLSETTYRSVLADVFPGQTEVVASWFSGNLVVPDGKLVEYVHMGYASTFETYIVLRIEKGIVTRRWNMNTEKFRQFRELQFAAFKGTDQFREALERSRQRALADERSFDPVRAERFIREFYSEEYLSTIYYSPPSP